MTFNMIVFSRPIEDDAGPRSQAYRTYWIWDGYKVVKILWFMWDNAKPLHFLLRQSFVSIFYLVAEIDKY